MLADIVRLYQEGRFSNVKTMCQLADWLFVCALSRRCVLNPVTVHFFIYILRSTQRETYHQFELPLLLGLRAGAHINPHTGVPKVNLAQFLFKIKTCLTFDIPTCRFAGCPLCNPTFRE
jgi:hypothetical protein